MSNSQTDSAISVREFPILASGCIHLNHSGIAPLTARARDAMVAYAQGAAESLDPGVHGAWIARVDAIRGRIAQYLNAKAAEIAFVKNTTQGLQVVANSVAWKPGDCIVVEAPTFPANWYVWKVLEERWGVKVLEWPERNFRYELEDLQALLWENRVRLVSLSAVDFSTGFRHDLAAAGKLIKDAGALFCVDGIQMLGAFPIDVEACRVDFISADSHKWLLGPEGAGLFYARQSVYGELNDSQAGWLGRKAPMNFEVRNAPPVESAKRFEEGALNIGGVLALGGSLDVLMEAGAERVAADVLRNRRHLIDGMRELGWETISPQDDEHAGGAAAFRREGVDSTKAAKALNEKRITCVARRGCVRLSPHFYQPVEQMDAVLQAAKGLGVRGEG